MNRLIAEWVWRLAVIGALAWIGMELRGLHDDMMQPVEDAPTMTADSDRIEQSIDDVRGDVADLTDKVDAILVAIARRN